MATPSKDPLRLSAATGAPTSAPLHLMSENQRAAARNDTQHAVPSIFTTLANQVSERVWAIDAETQSVVMANAPAQATAKTPGSVIGLRIAEVFDPQTSAWLRALVEGRRAGRALRKSIKAPAEAREAGGLALPLTASFAHEGGREYLLLVGGLSGIAGLDPRSAEAANWDGMTDMMNRQGFQQVLTHHLADDQTASASLSVMVMDLDRFKLINDVHGHAVGDVMICMAAKRMKRCLPPNSMIARLGGDEFAIVQHDVGDPLEIRILAQLLVDAMQAPFVLEGLEVRLGVSIGVVILDGLMMTADTILKNADLALHKAKANGRGTFVLFDPALDQARRYRRSIEAEIRPALMRGEFEAYYQPQLEIATGDITGFESLARWRHPTRGWISPGEFIPAAEELGLIERLGAHILNLACRSAGSWSQPLTVAVNVSSLQLRNRGFVSTVFQSLASAGLSTDRLELEITESVMLDEDPNVLDALNQLRALGVRLSLDDFGTGYASLSYLRRLPLNKVKIDQSFVRDLATNAGSRAIVSAVSQLARDLGMSVTAEGVETQEQLDILSAVGCTHVQGYLIGRPDPDPIARMAQCAALPLKKLEKSH